MKTAVRNGVCRTVRGVDDVLSTLFLCSRYRPFTVAHIAAPGGQVGDLIDGETDAGPGRPRRLSVDRLPVAVANPVGALSPVRRELHLAKRHRSALSVYIQLTRSDSATCSCRCQKKIVTQRRLSPHSTAPTPTSSRRSSRGCRCRCRGMRPLRCPRH